MAANKDHILEGRIFPALTKFSIPILLSLILQALYGAVDLWMVSRFADNGDISAVSTGSQTMMIVNGIITGLSMGITVLLGRSVGEGDKKKSADIIGTSMWIFIAIALFMTVILVMSSTPLAIFLNAPDTALEKTSGYLFICGTGTVFVVGYNVLNSIFCGIGDSKTPLVFVGIACAVNIISDYMLIDIFKLGAAGAAIATITAQAVGVLFFLCIIKKRLPFNVSKENMRLRKKIAVPVLRLGLPVAVLRMCTEVSYLVILGIVNIYGEVASSGVGIAEKLVMFILLIPTAYMSSISAFVAQNMGAEQTERAEKVLKAGIVSATAIGSIMAYISFFHGDVLSLLFTKDPQIIAASAEFLKATSIECLVLSVAYCFEGFLNGVEKTMLVMIPGVIAALSVRIPFAYVMSRRADASLFRIGLSTAFAALFMLIFSIITYIVIEKNIRPEHGRRS